MPALRYAPISLDREWFEVHGPDHCDNESRPFWRNEMRSNAPLAVLLHQIAADEIQHDRERQSDIRVCSCVFGELLPNPNLI